MKHLDERRDYESRELLRGLEEDVLCTGLYIDFEKSNLPLKSGFADRLIKNPACRKALEEELFHYYAKETVDILQKASRKPLFIWTLNAKERISSPRRAVWIDINNLRFDIYCDYDPVKSEGCSRGVQEIKIDLKNQPDMIPEPKLLPAPTGINNSDQSNHQSDLRKNHNTNELEYARRLLDGISGGNVLDWKRR